MASDEEVQAQQDRVAKLRAQVKDTRAGRLDKERELANTVTMTQLEAEEQRLLAELEMVKRGATKTAVKEGAGPVLGSAKEQMQAAQAQAKANAAQNDKN